MLQKKETNVFWGESRLRAQKKISDGQVARDKPLENGN
jgi:hypothetical protein